MSEIQMAFLCRVDIHNGWGKFLLKLLVVIMLVLKVEGQLLENFTTPNISSRNVKTTEGYRVINFEVAISNSF